jgi:hypothetical protein
MAMISHKKYLTALFITIGFFVVALIAANFFAQKGFTDIDHIKDQVAIDILSSETQYSLLEETSCKDLKPGFLSSSLGELADKLSYAENQSSFNQAKILSLRQSYFLLEIKDYLLMKSITEKCGVKSTFILYFYGDKAHCPDCEKTGFVLDALHEKYPNLRIYSFDYNSTEPAVKTLISIYHVEPKLPALIINSDPYYGFKNLDTLETTVPAITRLKTEYDKMKALQAATSTATTTKKN